MDTCILESQNETASSDPLKLKPSPGHRGLPTFDPQSLRDPSAHSHRLGLFCRSYRSYMDVVKHLGLPCHDLPIGDHRLVSFCALSDGPAADYLLTTAMPLQEPAGVQAATSTLPAGAVVACTLTVPGMSAIRSGSRVQHLHSFWHHESTADERDGQHILFISFHHIR